MSAAEQFHSLGAELVDFVHGSANPPHTGFRQDASILEPLLGSRSWAMRTFSFRSAAQLRHFDTVALTVFPPEDRLRRRWIEAAPRVLQRERPPQRCLWLSPQEEEKLSEVLLSIG
jgi:urocanate hydratase